MKRVNLLALKLMLLMAACPLISFAQKYHQVASNDCGDPQAQPFLVEGEDYLMPVELGGSVSSRSCNFGGRVIYAFDQLDIQADYQLELTYFSDSERRQKVVVDGIDVQAPFTLIKGKEQRYRIDLPKRAYAYGQLVLNFEVLKGPNAIVSEIRLYSSNPQKVLPFTKERQVDLRNQPKFQVDTAVVVDHLLPTYAPLPEAVGGVYDPIKSLNGTWFFSQSAFPGFEKPSFAEEQWHTITVPGQWSMQGYEVDSACFAAYRKHFRLPQDWQDKQVRLRFDGVSSECVVYLNGREVTDHLGGMTAFECDITNHLQPGENVLALKVRSESLADMLGSLTQYAAHQLGGITRKVTLFALPKVHFSDIQIETDLDDHYRDANLSVRIDLQNKALAYHQNLEVRAILQGSDIVLTGHLDKISAHVTQQLHLSAPVKNPRKWNNEQPNLYTLLVELSSDGEVLMQTQHPVGFREVEVVGNQLLVNGKAVKLRGVCRHEVHPLTGRVMTEELQEQDLRLFQQANCNFIRTAHYPPSEELLHLADRLGMFVEVESPICWIGHHANENWKTLNYQDSIYYPYVLQANLETIQFYRNYPSVIFWSIANESYWNREFAQVQEYVRKADTTRPWTFHDQGYGGFNNQGSNAPISNFHYPGPNGAKAAQESDRPMIFGEYCHLNVYNRSELETDPGVRSDWALALKPMWESMHATTAVLGGSLWSGIDDIFQLPDGNAVGYGAWGPIDGWRRPKPEYWDMKKIYSPIRLYTEELNPAHTLELDFENRYTYLSTDQLQINWSFGPENGRLDLSLLPGERGLSHIDISNPNAARQLRLEVVDPRGFIADEYLIPVGEQTQNQLPSLPEKPTSFRRTKDLIVVRGKGFRAEVCGKSGKIRSVEKDGHTYLVGGPHLMVLPLTGGGCYPNHNANTPLFNELCANWELWAVDVTQVGESVEVRVEGQYDTAVGYYILRFNSEGICQVTYEFDMKKEVNPRQWGMVFEAPRSFDQHFWRRQGEWSVYPSDHISRPVGTASLFYEGLPKAINPRIAPTWSWSKDYNQLGSNDFRSTRRNFWYAGLTNTQDNTSVVATSTDASQHWRSWLSEKKICFLVADFVTAGNEMFLGSYYAPYRRPLKMGDKIKGEVNLRILPSQIKR